MKKRSINIAIVFLLITILLSVSGCSSNLKDQGIVVTLVNNSSEDFHLWIGHGQSPSPSNKVPSGQSISYNAVVKATFAKDGSFECLTDKVTCSAGKNGNTLLTTKINVSKVKATSVTISWNGSGFSLSY